MNLLMFFLGTVGMTQIIVDGSILEGFRKYFKIAFKLVGLEHLGSLVDCYLCTGTWCGFFMGYIWVSHDPLEVFACGCAGGFLSSLGSSVLNWIESATIVNLPQDE